MFTYYGDILEKLGPAIWYTEDGYPRYCEFAPNECGVHTKAVALLEIACQDCDKRFLVASEWGNTMELATRAGCDAALAADKLIRVNPDEFRSEYVGDETSIRAGDLREALRWKIEGVTRPTEGQSGSFGTSDPPNHRCIGDTMSAWNLRVVEYWERERDQEQYVDEKGTIDTKRYKADKGHDYFEWVRYPENEVEIERPI